MLKVLVVSPLLLPYYQKHLERAKNVCNYVTYTEKENVLVYFSKLFSKNQFKKGLFGVTVVILLSTTKMSLKALT